MTKRDDTVDFTILGGGMAGLQIASTLASRLRGTGRRALVVEPRSQYTDDRTFCFWNVEPIAAESLAAHRWSQWKLKAGGRSHIAASDRYSYCCIPGEAFYDDALKSLEASEEVELRRGVNALSVDRPRGAAALEVSLGESTVTSNVVYDTRPSKELIERADILQHFMGWRVKTDSAVFDPQTVTLMDFDVSQAHGLHFMYVLPFSETEALIESTFFSPEVVDNSVYASLMTDYLRDEYGLSDAEFRVMRQERGIVPMTTAELVETGDDAWHRLGTPGGFVRPATGYCFHQTSRWIEGHASWLAEPSGDRPPVRSMGLKWLDAVLLSFLLHRPEDAPQVFLGLFERVPPDALVRFLSDVGSLADTLRVMWAMPVIPFVKEAMRLGRVAPLQIRESASGSM